MEFRLLGPVEVASGGRPIEVGPPQRCTVLAALAVDAGRPVTVETLIDRVWGEQPPERVRRALHAHVTRIRRLLEHAGTADEPPTRLLRRPGVYVLDVDPDRVDLLRFRRLYDRSRDPACGESVRVALLRDALDLWRGEPLAGLTGQWAGRTRQGWRQQHLDAVLLWASAELRAGDPGAVLGPLTDLVGEHALLEPLVAVLMRALHTVGRSAEALDLYTVTRNRLVAELGVEPGAQLQRIHQGILRDDLDHHDPPASTPAPPPVPARVAPAQLPRDARGFTGRRDELARLDATLPAAGEPGGAMVISALSGTAGVGKTALAVHWAHRIRDRFPDGQLYVNLRGFDPGGSVMDPAEAVRGFLDALQVPPQRIPADLDAQAALYRSELSNRRVLVLLDNARDTAQVRPLLPGAATCLVLVTSRNQLTGLVAADGAHAITLDLLPPAEARDLLAHRLGPDRVAAEPVAVDEIIGHCARLPLALAIVAARAATDPRRSLPALAAEIRDSRGRLDALTTDDPHTDVRAVLSWSYRALTPEAARLFRLLGLHPGPDISTSAAASLAALPRPRVRPPLAELVRAHLIVEQAPGRYAFHDLLRAYATEQAHRVDPDEQRGAATRRILDHYLHTAHAAAVLLEPAREPIALTPPEPGVTVERLADHQQALDWYTVEHAALLAALGRAAADGFDTHAWQLAWTLDDFLDRRGHWHDLVASARVAVAATQRLGDLSVRAGAERNLAHAHTRLGRLDVAHTHLRHALDLFRQAGDVAGQARTHHYVGRVWARQGRHAEALDHARQALDLNRAAGHRRGQALALNAVGWYHALLGDHEQTLAACREALTLLQELGDRAGQADTWDSLGYAHHRLGDHAQAIACYREALDMYRDMGDRYNVADTFTYLGEVHHATGDHDAARRAWREALRLLDQLDHPDADGVRRKLAALDDPEPDPLAGPSG